MILFSGSQDSVLLSHNQETPKKCQKEKENAKLQFVRNIAEKS